MSNNNFITKLLNIKDPNIIFTENIKEIKKKGIIYNVINAKLSYIPECCTICGIVNNNFNIIKMAQKLVILSFYL